MNVFQTAPSTLTAFYHADPEDWPWKNTSEFYN